MALTVLNVAYPLAPVGPDAVGGAEQVLTHLDAALVEARHTSLVVASEESAPAGTHFATPTVNGHLNRANEAVQARHRAAVERALSRWEVDLVHMHGVDFHTYLPPPGPPVLVTLHLPPSWYPEQVFHLDRPRTQLQCVSASQRADCPPAAGELPVIENGVAAHDPPLPHATRRFVLALGRICPEKGFHHALDAASRAGRPCLIAGTVYPYSAHQAYFDEQIAPRLTESHRFIGPIFDARKQRFLASACALLIPSEVRETSSLVAMEALACGTPVIAFRRGALPDIVDHGTTGFLVDDADEMADAIGAVDHLDPEVCRTVARERFALDRMQREYLDLYATLAGAPHSSPHRHSAPSGAGA